MTTESAARLTIYSRSTLKRRGLSVWQTAPIPIIPYQHSRCRPLFMAIVATRSPGTMPSDTSADEKRRAVASTSA